MAYYYYDVTEPARDIVGRATDRRFRDLVFDPRAPFISYGTETSSLSRILSRMVRAGVRPRLCFPIGCNTVYVVLKIPV